MDKVVMIFITKQKMFKKKNTYIHQCDIPYMGNLKRNHTNEPTERDSRS